MRGPGHDQGRRGDRRGGIDDQNGQPGQHGPGRREHRDGLDDVPDGQDPLSRVSIAERRGRRRDEGRRHELCERDEPHRRRARPVVGVDEDRHPRPEFRCVEREVRGQHPPEVPVREDAAQDRGRASRGFHGHRW